MRLRQTMRRNSPTWAASYQCQSGQSPTSLTNSACRGSSRIQATRQVVNEKRRPEGRRWQSDRLSEVRPLKTWRRARAQPRARRGAREWPWGPAGRTWRAGSPFPRSACPAGTPPRAPASIPILYDIIVSGPFWLGFAETDLMTPESQMPESSPPPAGLPLFFNRIVGVDPKLHGNLRLDRNAGFGFAAGAQFVPLGFEEIEAAAQDYPILFTAGTEPVVIALLGLRQGNNLFVQADGSWKPDTYIPAYVRTFPFVCLSSTSSSELYLGMEPDAACLNTEK